MVKAFHIQSLGKSARIKKKKKILDFHIIYFIFHSLRAAPKTEMATVRKLVTQGRVLLQLE